MKCGFTGFIVLIYCSSLFVTGAGAINPFLQPVSFPKTFNDLSFESRMAVLADGYDDVGTEYDENGVCISGCAYTGMTLADEERLIQQAGEELQQLLQQQAQQVQPLQSGGAQSLQSNGTQPLQSGVTQPVQSGGTQPVQSGGIQPVQLGGAQSGSSGGGLVNTKGKFFGPPVSGNVMLTSDFGERRPPKTSNGSGSRYHRGLDIRASANTPLYAAADGKVVRSGWSGGYGNVIEIEHPLGDKKVKTVYAHMNRRDVKVGDGVRQGQLIGLAGNTGNSGGAHLHYEVRFNNVRVDPLGAYIKPVLDKNVDIASSTRGTNYLGAEYCFKPGISSVRLRPLANDTAALKEKFPGCTGWCAY